MHIKHGEEMLYQRTAKLLHHKAGETVLADQPRDRRRDNEYHEETEAGAASKVAVRGVVETRPLNQVE
eukprot:750154-Hanusia_phi.AAC.6